MQIMLTSQDSKVLDNTVKVLLNVLGSIKYVELLRKKTKVTQQPSQVRCRILCSAVKVSVITKLELPEMVHISIKY